MTVIAWDGKMIAADKQVSWGDAAGKVTKIFRLDDGSIIAFCGAGHRAKLYVDWFNSERNPYQYPKSEGDDKTYVYRVANNRMQLWDHEKPTYMEIEDRIFSTGCGQNYAMALLHIGKSAYEAVKITCQLSTACGMGIDYMYTTDTHLTSTDVPTPTHEPDKPLTSGL